jgi:hypothetical protein
VVGRPSLFAATTSESNVFSDFSGRIDKNGWFGYRGGLALRFQCTPPGYSNYQKWSSPTIKATPSPSEIGEQKHHEQSATGTEAFHPQDPDTPGPPQSISQRNDARPAA